MTYSCTYSADDNKLRLTASSRLDQDLYARVKAAGFSWAPMQKIFIAPMWTPEREDLLLELCGEIGDEDTSLVERAEERAERFEDYSDSRREDAERAKAGVDRIADGIPLGQPILIGHHSERHARKDAERIETGMRKAIKMWDTANYWKSRAAGAIRAAKHKERPDVRARRIKGIEADIRSYIASYTPHPNTPALMQTKWNDHGPDAKPVPHVFVGPHGRGGHWVAAESIEGIKARAQRWLQHLNNRLEYEKAMLADGGGLAADQFDIQVGGRVCRRGEWFVVTKLNQKDGVLLSLSIAGHWAGTIPIEDVRDYQPPAEGDAEQVKAAMKAPPLVNFRAKDCIEMTMAEWKQHTKWSDSYFAATFDINGNHTYGRTSQGETAIAYRQRSSSGRGQCYRRIPVFITDAKMVEPPKIAAPRVALPARPAREAQPVYRPRESNQGLDALREQLKAGVKVFSAPQLFPTPPDLARRMCYEAGGLAGCRVLEPSAGTGNIIRAVFNNATGADCVRVVAVEANHSLAGNLRQMQLKTLYANDSNFTIHCADFLECNGDLGLFDAVIMNPPFENAVDISHILHARAFLKPGGRLVAICANGPRQRERLKPLASMWEDLPPDTFKEAGTGVNVALLTIEAAS